jgi:hypothetical protein
VTLGQRPEASEVFLRNGNGLGRPDWLADDPVYYEPVSRPQFPDNREKYREFRKTWLLASPEVPNSADAIGVSDTIPYVPEQGTAEAITGNLIRKIRTFAQMR